MEECSGPDLELLPAEVGSGHVRDQVQVLMPEGLLVDEEGHFLRHLGPSTQSLRAWHRSPDLGASHLVEQGRNVRLRLRGTVPDLAANLSGHGHSWGVAVSVKWFSITAQLPAFLFILDLHTPQSRARQAELCQLPVPPPAQPGLVQVGCCPRRL
jgi:hypothetical protein